MSLEPEISEDKALLKEKVHDILGIDKEVSKIPHEIKERLFGIIKNTGELAVYVTIIGGYQRNIYRNDEKFVTNDFIGWHPFESVARLNELLSLDQKPTTF